VFGGFGADCFRTALTRALVRITWELDWTGLPRAELREHDLAGTNLFRVGRCTRLLFMRVLLAFIVVAAASCAVALADTRPPATDAQVRHAYYDAPLITNRQARAVPYGITPRQLYRRLHGYSLNAQSRAHGRNWKICVTYPVKGTGVKDERLGVVADEWLFCFGFNKRLKRKFFWNS